MVSRNFLNKNNSLVNEYFDLCKEYEDKYSKCIVLIEVGSFYEAYAIDNDTEKIGHAQIVGELLNITVTRKNKSILENSRKNPLMSGFTSPVLDKYLKILIEYGYTVVLVEQVTPPPSPERKVTQIVSPGTYMKNTTIDKNNIVSIYIEKNKTKGVFYNCIGFSVIDLTTGQNSVTEVVDKKEDLNFAFDEAVRFILANTPNDILVNTKGIDMTRENISNKLHLYNKNQVHIRINNVEKDYHKTSFQQQFLQEVFGNTNLLSPIEYVDMERMEFARMSYILLLNYAYQHNEKIIKHIEKPTILSNNKYLQLDTTAIAQLNIVSDNKCNGPFSSLFKVINYTSNVMGRRLLKERLLNPIIDVSILKKRYNQTSVMIKKDRYKDYEQFLKLFNDMERLHRKISLGLIHPHELEGLFNSYQLLPKLIKLTREDKELNVKLCPTKLTKFIDDFGSKFNLDMIKMYSIDNIEKSFFRHGVDDEIDELQEIIDENLENLNDINDTISDMISSHCPKNKKPGYKFSTLGKYEQSGYYIKFSNARAKHLQKELDEIEEIHINDYVIKMKDVVVKKKDGSNKMLCHAFIKKWSDLVLESQVQMKKIAKDLYIEILGEIYDKHKEILKSIELYISELDVIKSTAKCAIKNNYCKPNCVKNKEAFVRSTDMRHPLVEKLETRVPYVTNNCILDNKNSGVILYGVNGVGKSVYLKSIGLNIILAQSGNFTACKTFSYSPFHTILTRILGNDNIFTNSSSFQVEMNELKTILKRSNNKSLVLSDELCRGTEFISSTSLVASSVIMLSKLNAKFVLTTHLHKLCTLSDIKELNNVDIQHMKVIFDNNNNMIYNRKIEKGDLSNICYGIQIADKLGLGNIKGFIETSERIRKKLLNISSDILPTKNSRYNKDLYLKDCKLCSKKFDDVHHIKFQKDADTNGFFKDVPYHKNKLFNLVALCKSCHNKIHNGEINITGKVMTSNGVSIK